MSLPSELLKLNQRMLATSPPLHMKTASSLLFTEFRALLSVHHFALAGTIASAISEMVEWWKTADKNDPANLVFADQALHRMKDAVDALEESDTAILFSVFRTIATKAVQLAGFDSITKVIDLIDAIYDCTDTASLTTKDWRDTDKTLATIEARIRIYLAHALLVESHVGSVSGRFCNLDKTHEQLRCEWKRPISARIRKSCDMFEAEGRHFAFIRLPDDDHDIWW